MSKLKSTQEQIDKVRQLYAELSGKAERIRINRRVVELMGEKFKIELPTRNYQTTWIGGQRDYSSPHDLEWLYCYATAFLEKKQMEKKSLEKAAQLAEA